MTFTLDKTAISDDLKRFLADCVSPRANQLDTDAALLFSAFDELGKRGWLTPKLPKSLGGLDFSTSEYQQFQSILAQHSGALAFLQTQHQSAASLILSGDNSVLQARYLQAMSAGLAKVGVGFSHLRRRPVPLSATRVEGGYRLSGKVPWVTGAGLFSHFVGAATLPDGQAVFGLLPLTTQPSRIEVSEPMKLAGMSATSTVEISINDWVMNDPDIIGTKEKGWLEGRDRANPLSPVGLFLGCTQGAIATLEQALSRRQIDHNIAQQLKLKLAWLQMDLPRVMALPLEAFEQKMALRGRAIALMNTCSQAAVVASSGAANVLSHPAQRLYKESLVFSVSGQTTAGAITTLNALL